VPWHQFPYSIVCPSMMSVYLEGPDSPRDTRVSLTNAGMMLGIIKCCWVSLYPMVCGGRWQVVTNMSVLRNPPRSGRGVEGP
jgi:hypothetical protein